MMAMFACTAVWTPCQVGEKAGGGLEVWAEVCCGPDMDVLLGAARGLRARVYASGLGSGERQSDPERGRGGAPHLAIGDEPVRVLERPHAGLGAGAELAIRGARVDAEAHQLGLDLSHLGAS